MRTDTDRSGRLSQRLSCMIRRAKRVNQQCSGFSLSQCFTKCRHHPDAYCSVIVFRCCDCPSESSVFRRVAYSAGILADLPNRELWGLHCRTIESIPRSTHDRTPSPTTQHAGPDDSTNRSGLRHPWRHPTHASRLAWQLAASHAVRKLCLGHTRLQLGLQHY